MEKKNLHIPTLSNLKFGNIFSGSCKDFNFKIFPNCDEVKMKIAVWKGKNCFEKSDILQEKIFDLDEQGMQSAISWLEKKNLELTQK